MNPPIGKYRAPNLQRPAEIRLKEVKPVHNLNLCPLLQKPF